VLWKSCVLLRILSKICAASEIPEFRKVIELNSRSEFLCLVGKAVRIEGKQEIPFVFTDRHAYLQAAEFYNDLNRLDRIDWPRIQARDFRRDPEDPGKVERYQAEGLIYRYLPLAALLGIICSRDEERTKIEEECGRLGLMKEVLCRPGWYL
jgi:ssDNA thymidine ADP-ribosyltransferase, DarT